MKVRVELELNANTYREAERIAKDISKRDDVKSVTLILIERKVVNWGTKDK